MKKLHLVLAISTALSLCAFGWAQVASRTGSTNSTASQKPPMKAASKEAAERQFLQSLRLSPDQTRALDGMYRTAAEGYASIPGLKTKEERVSRGVAVAEARAATLKEVLNPTQYKAYDQWVESRVQAKHGGTDPVNAGATNSAILGTLGLNRTQEKALAQLQNRLLEANHTFYRLTETDSLGAAWYSHVVNSMSVEGTKSILTAEQFKSWQQQWARSFGLSK
ncbi:MAG: hypothetical protein JSS65_11870 [Armatimonadetes bacterium]|nr:hypothetical protein [Armatimonadota bacterium]